MSGERAHAELVALARRWLASTRRCAVVATERMATYAAESPDAIGWRPDGHSILVEVKTTLGDFYADRRKPSRSGQAPAMGRERWYLTAGLSLAGRELPTGWGWLELRGGRIYRVVHAFVHGADAAILAAELPLLVAVTRNALGGWRGNGVITGEPVEEEASDAA